MNFVFNTLVTTQQNLANGDSADVTSSGLIYPPDGSEGIFDPGSASVLVDGSVYGSNGIGLDGTVLTSNITVDATGSVVSQPGGNGIVVGPHSIVNNGQIYSPGSNGFGVLQFGGGITVNNGIIAGGIGIFDNDSTAADTNNIVNHGSLSGITDAFDGGGGAETQDFSNFGVVSGKSLMGTGNGDFFYNTTTGDVAGNIQLGSGSNDVVYNNGLINGNIMLGNGAHAVYGGSPGQLNGAVVAGSGGDTIYAGSGATDIFGGSGTDALVGGTGMDGIFPGTGNGDFIQAGSGVTLIGFESTSIIANHFEGVENFGANTFLMLPSADMATTSFAAANGGTLVGVAAGGSTFDVFVVGVAPSAVQAHTLFNL
jgi:hypothetical protein